MKLFIILFHLQFKLNTIKYLDILVVVRYVNFFIYYKNQAKNYLYGFDSIVNPYYKGLRLDNATNLLYNLRHNMDIFVYLTGIHIIYNFKFKKIYSNYILYIILLIYLIINQIYLLLKIDLFLYQHPKEDLIYF